VVVVVGCVVVVVGSVVVVVDGFVVGALLAVQAEMTTTNTSVKASMRRGIRPTMS
jgi:hypothetical protein